MRKLLIVESPTKARTIEKMLGKDYMIVASMGHIRDLPEHELGVDIENKFAPRYVDTARSRSVVKQLRDSAARADEIYLAPDPDREGEAIAWHIYEVLKNKAKAPFYRVTFHEITRSAIEQALNNRGGINLNLVDAQQARRVLDRIVGYQVSPLLWSNLKKGSSAIRDPKAYLMTTLKHEIAGFYRSGAVRRTVPLTLVEDEPDDLSVEDLSLDHAAVGDVLEALKREPQSTQRMFILYYGYGMKLGDIAKETGTTEAGVKSRLARVRKKLRTSLGEENTL